MTQVIALCDINNSLNDGGMQHMIAFGYEKRKQKVVMAQ